MDSGVLFITPGGLRQSLLFSQGPWPTFVKTLYTLSVLLKPTSLNSLNLAWKMLKGDIIRLKPWLIIRRVSCLYIVACTNGCHKDYKGDWLHRGLLYSFWQWEILLWSLVLISPGGQFSPRYVIPMATGHIHSPKFTESTRWSFLLFQDGVSLACSFPPSDILNFWLISIQVDFLSWRSYLLYKWIWVLDLLYLIKERLYTYIKKVQHTAKKGQMFLIYTY